MSRYPFQTYVLCPDCFRDHVVQDTPTAAHCPGCGQTYIKAEGSNTLRYPPKEDYYDHTGSD
jgi:ribosomal protein S27E